MEQQQQPVKKQVLSATGRRKTSIARVRLMPEGKGKITVNGKEMTNYFCSVDQQTQVKKPLVSTGMESKMDVLASVTGGGITGQAGALSLGISRCLLELDPQLRSVLRKASLLTRDPRAKERKKYGRKGARRRFQWTKR